MRRARSIRTGSTKARLPAWLARLGLWLAAFALLSQSLAVAAAPAHDAFAASLELRTLLGPSVVVCAHDDSSPAPAEAHDHCPLCGVAAAAFDAPCRPAPPAAPRRLEAELVPAPPPLRLSAQRPIVSFARGPPSRT